MTNSAPVFPEEIIRSDSLFFTLSHAETALSDLLKRREVLTAEKIAQAEAKAIGEVKAEAVEIALAATERLLRERIDEAKADELLDAAIKDIPARL